MVRRNLKILLSVCCFGLITLLSPTSLWGKEFIIVIDAGHGGRDPGAVGKTSKEKDINLKVALKVGKMIENNCPDVKVIYTRKTDVFVTLEKRAQIANNAKADLFVSIHTNAVAKNKSIKGTEIYTLGLGRSEANLEIAKRENSVILIEDNYHERYAGFNPNSAESYIIFELMQDKHMEKSVKLAQLIQNQFKHQTQRNNRGVQQAGFLVLRATTMPSILVELGYISTPSEEKYLNSSEGIEELSKGIYNALITYRKDHQITSKSMHTIADNTTSQQQAPKEKPSTGNKASTNTNITTNNNKPVFKIQILTSPKVLKKNDQQFKGLKPVSYYVENGLYKYTYIESTDYNKVLKAKKEVNSKFKDAFIIAFKNEKKINVQEAIKEFKNNSK